MYCREVELGEPPPELGLPPAGVYTLPAELSRVVAGGP